VVAEESRLVERVTPFAIAAMQLSLSDRERNLPRMRERLDVLMRVYPWVELVLFSELAAHGPSPSAAEPMPGPTEEVFRDMARAHRVWLLPG
jgi:predicted amidohydrolase